MNRRLHRVVVALVLAVTLIALAALAGCFPHSPGYYGPAPHQGRRHNCPTTCVDWAERSRCDRHCGVWANGMCMAWQQRCRPERYCARYEPRCY